MDISKTTSINGDYRERKSPLLWSTRLFAEVILVDKTHDSLHPLIYQLKDTFVPNQEQVLNWKTGEVTFPREAFALLDEAATIDREKKQILLSNNNTISYKYLIIACGKKPILSFEEETFIPAIQALVDALRVKTKIPSSFAQLDTLIENTNNPFFGAASHDHLSQIQARTNTIGTFAKPHIAQTFSHKFFGPDLRAINRRLYEVHL